MAGFIVMVYGSWGSEPYSFEDTLEAAKEAARTASARKPQDEYCVEIDPGSPDNPLYHNGEQIGGFDR